MSSANLAYPPSPAQRGGQVEIPHSPPVGRGLGGVSLDPALAALESEAIYVLRETFGQFERPVLLFSGGKDSIVLAHLAARAFHPGRIPFKLLHIDTGHNFAETLAFRDNLARELRADLLVRYVQDTIDQGRAVEETGPEGTRNALQTRTLLDALAELRADAALGGARRDEEKARAKERFFSHRDRHGQWDPKNQRPELWSLYNGRYLPGEHFRVFPLSNWTELDIWRYVQARQIALPSLYFAHTRQVFCRRGVWLSESELLPLLPGEHYETQQVRFRTMGDITVTGAVLSDATTLGQIIEEVRTFRVTERSGRGDDKRSEAAMEDRKRAGYF